MKKFMIAFAIALFASEASACEQAMQYYMPSYYQSSMQYAMPSYGYQQSYRVQAPTYIAPSRNAQLGFPAQTPITIINNNNNNGGGGPAGSFRSFQNAPMFAPSVGFAPVGFGGGPLIQQNFVGRRAFRFR